MKAPKTTVKKKAASTSAFHGRLTKANKVWLTKQARLGKTTQTSILNDLIEKHRRP